MHSVEPSLTGLNTSCYSKELLRAKRMHFSPILLTYYVYRYLAISNYQQLTIQPSNLGLPKVGKNVPTRQHTLIIMIIGDMPHKWISSQWNLLGFGHGYNVLTEGVPCNNRTNLIEMAGKQHNVKIHISVEIFSLMLEHDDTYWSVG